MIASKLTSKSQTTIPRPVRAAPGVAAGDEVVYTIEPGRVILSKVPPRPSPGARMAEDPFGTFAEWDPETDRAAYANL